MLALILLAATFQAGAARRDITPREPVPMWGYGARHDALSTGVRDPLYADALVIQAGDRKLAIVGLDLGRSPSEASLQRIRDRIRTAGIEHSMIAGSHTHHGPVLELSDQPGKGRGKFDAAIRYYRSLEDAIVEAILEANSRLVPARMAASTRTVDGLNRNRHTRLEPKPRDTTLGLLRFDTAEGKPLALLFNFAAHPTTLPAENLRFSADWVGEAKNALREQTKTAVIFMQGAAGDQSVASREDFGVKIASAVVLPQTVAPESPSLEVNEERFRFDSRTDFKSPVVQGMFEKAFFPELVANYLDEYQDGIRPRLTVALLNRDVALVCASGEFFSAHSNRLRERLRVPNVLFFGYCNGYHQYFPTIEAAAEGGYGADNRVAPAEVGAGERIMDAALVRLYRMLGKLRY
jgi:hypothetical protein